MRETLFYAVVIIVSLVVIVISNRYINNLKMEQCEKRDGTFVLNTSDSNKSACILKGN